MEVIDPSHLQALAQRVLTLGERVKTLGDKDEGLCERIDDLTSMLDKRLPTEDEMKSLREILSNKSGKEYLQKQFRKWGLGTFGFLATLYVTRDYITRFLGWLSKVLQ